LQTYAESGKPNIKLISKEYAHRELRRMIGGDADPDQQRANEFRGPLSRSNIPNTKYSRANVR